MARRAPHTGTSAGGRRRGPTATATQLVGPVVAVLLVPAPVVQAAWWGDPTRRQGPLLIAQPGGCVLAVCPRAADAGLRPGQTVAQVRLGCPQAHVVAPDRAMAAVLWRVALRALTEEVAPVVETTSAAHGVLYLDAHGLERLVGDPSAVARRALTALTGQGIAARAGAGSSRVVARALAARMDDRGPRTLLGDAARAFLHGLPIGDPALNVDTAVAAALREVGVTTAALLATLPERSLGLRYGPAAMRAWQAATGASEPPLHPWVAPPSHIVAARLEEAVDDATIITTILRRLAGELAAWLHGGGRAAATLALCVVCETGSRCVRAIDQDPPLQEERAIAATILEVWRRLPAPAPVAEIALEASDLTTPVAEQATLWGSDVDPLARRQERLMRALTAHARCFGQGQMRRACPDPRALDGWRWGEYEPG